MGKSTLIEVPHARRSMSWAMAGLFGLDQEQCGGGRVGLEDGDIVRGECQLETIVDTLAGSKL